MTNIKILNGDCRDILPTLADNSFDCVVTSPPYWGLRDYGVEGQIGLESTMGEYLNAMVGVCRELRRVLKPGGTFWLNIGDTYASAWVCNRRNVIGSGSLPAGRRADRPNRLTDGLKEKDLCMIPNRLAIALQEDGWYVRSEIIWHKPNPMPESVRDRPTSAHEKVWLLTKSPKYFYDAKAIEEPSVQPDRVRSDKIGGASHKERGQHSEGGLFIGSQARNARNVWTITTKPFKGAHFAVMPIELAERCIKAGCPEGGMVFDPFGGSGTTGLAAKKLNRNATLIELNSAYRDIAEIRVSEMGSLI